jgi:hypothetical protein
LLDSRTFVGETLDEVKIIGKKGEKILVWKNYASGAKPVWIQQKNLEKHLPDLIDPPEGTTDEYPPVGDIGSGGELEPLPGQNQVPELSGWIPSVKLKNLAKKLKAQGVKPQNTFSKALAAGEPLPKEVPPSAGGVDGLLDLLGMPKPKEPEKPEPAAEPEPNVTKTPEPEPSPKAGDQPALPAVEFSNAVLKKDVDYFKKNANKLTSMQVDSLGYYAETAGDEGDFKTAAGLASVAVDHYKKKAEGATLPAGKSAYAAHIQKWQKALEGYTLAMIGEAPKEPDVPVPPPPEVNEPDPDFVFDWKGKAPAGYEPPSPDEAFEFQKSLGLAKDEFVLPNDEVYKVLDLKPTEYVDPKGGFVIVASTGKQAKNKQVTPTGNTVEKTMFGKVKTTPAAKKAPPEDQVQHPEPEIFVTPSKVTKKDLPPPVAPAIPEPVKLSDQKKAALEMKTPEGLPEIDSLKMVGSGNFLGGAGDKVIYEDDKGQKWMHKAAYEKGGGKAKPYSAAAQQLWSEVARTVDDQHLVVGVTEVNKKFGTLQPLIDLDPDQPNLANVNPKTLSNEDRASITQEHVLDWLMSQHDSHGANFVRRKDGKILSVDKEQGFRFFGEDELSTEYAPNSKLYGEKPPYYNALWKGAAKGDYPIEPLVEGTKKTIEKLEKMSTAAYMKATRPYAETIFPKKIQAQNDLLKKMRKRKLDLRKDFEKLITTVYQSKENTDKGVFTFDKGWVPEGSGPKKVKKKISFKLSEADSPNSALKKEPSGWYISATGFEGLKIRPYHNPKTPTEKDDSKLTIKIPNDDLNGLDKLKKLFDELNLKPLVNPLTGKADHIEGSQYMMMFVDKKALESASTEIEEIVEPKGIADAPSTPRYFTDDHENPKATDNAKEFKQVASTTLGKWGKGFSSDGPSVEGSVMRAKRYRTASGQDYHYVHFKLRKPQWESLKDSGNEGQWKFPHASYDSENDVFVEVGGYSDSVSTRTWKIGDSEVHLATGAHKYAYMGSVYVKARPKKGETVEDVVKQSLDTMKPGLAKDVLRDPTPEEKETHRLSRILWALSPQKADALKEEDRTVENLTSMIKKIKGGKDAMKATVHEEVYPGYSAHVQKGRHKKLAGGNFRFAFHGADEGAILSILRTGPMGIHERNQHGIAKTGVSYEQDVNSGSGDGVLCHTVCASGDNTSINGYSFAKSWQVVIHPEELDRMDTYMFMKDTYGRCREDSPDWTGRKSLEARLDAQQKNAATTTELSFRKGVRPERMMRIVAPSESARKAMIKNARASGIQEVNGVPVEDFFIIEKNAGKIYEKYIKPVVETD